MIYRLVRLLSRLGIRVFFRDVEIEGRERVPIDGPLLLAANHANAFVDALLLSVVVPRPLTLTAKATLRGNPLLRWLIDGLGIVELARRQDAGPDAVPGRNRAAFVACDAVLRRGGALCLFPEGVSHSDSSLRPFRTGTARIALDFTADAPKGPPLRIVPVALCYEAKERLRSSIVVRFGSPIDVAAWARDRGDGAVEALTAELEARIGAAALEFGRRREALLLDWSAEVLASRAAPAPLDAVGATYGDRLARVERLQEGWEALTRAEDPDVGPLIERLRAYRQTLRREGISADEVFLPLAPLAALVFALREAEILVLGAPIAALGVVQHGAVALGLRALARRLSRDRDHWASNVIVPGLFAWPLAVAIGAAITGTLLSWPWALGWVLAAPFTLVYATLYLERAGRAARRVRSFARLAISSRRREALRREAVELVAAMEVLLARADRLRAAAVAESESSTRATTRT